MKNKKALCIIALVIVTILIIFPFGLDSYEPLVLGWMPAWILVKWILFLFLAFLNTYIWMT